MKKKLLALVCALALTFSFAGCTISTPDTVGSIGDFEITSGMYLSVTLQPDEKPLELLQSILKAMAEILNGGEKAKASK